MAPAKPAAAKPAKAAAKGLGAFFHPKAVAKPAAATAGVTPVVPAVAPPSPLVQAAHPPLEALVLQIGEMRDQVCLGISKP